MRPGQEETVRTVIAGRDTLAVQPTGSGKSAIYQAAGLLMPGITVVVSPLIALQKDQMEAINEQPHDARAVTINSTLRAAEMRKTLAAIESGEVEFVLLAPEQLRNQELVEALRRAAPSLLVVDEAHCISEWGHDFRRDYTLLGSVCEALGRPVVLALTATASPVVRRDICEQLGLRDPAVFVRGFDRPNISLRVDTFHSADDKLTSLMSRVRFAEKPGIVYVATRKNAEKVMSALRESGVESLFYHGGLKAAERAEIQNRFMKGEDEQVLVATNAFGMGIDKADIRFVYHFDICDSLDSYYQEVGRAGRDGEPADAVLFYRAEDLGLRRFQGGESKKDRVDLMQRYAELTTCRRAFLLEYFGEPFAGPCGCCDNDATVGADGVRRVVTVE
ncbi:hypothetical protein F183_A31640 [Bryobacterales bacterium F-183]|nr:hypothetical protein F183_A31640 [Bryobacterales bacterium F-183]